jgi:hypothetical protein
MTPGYVFCDIYVTMFCNISVTARVDCTRPWNHKSVSSYLRSRFLMIGQGSDVANRFSGHYIKREPVQLYRKISMHDVWIINRINMTAEGAHARYTEMLNDAAPEPTTKFWMFTRLLSGRRYMPVPVSMKLSTTNAMTPRMNEHILCDLWKNLLAKSVLAKLAVLIAPELNLMHYYSVVG